jgi:hypothetical protein
MQTLFGCQNIRIEQQGTKIVLEIETDPNKVEAVPSSSGKTLVIASTRGNKQVAENLYLGLNAYIKP